MIITEVRIHLASNSLPQSSRFRAYASITIDDRFVVHDIRIIESMSGVFIVAMPSKKPSVICPRCRRRSEANNYCGHCGMEFVRGEAGRDLEDDLGTAPPRSSPSKPTYREIAHPVSRECRADVEDAVLDAYARAVEEVVCGR